MTRLFLSFDYELVWGVYDRVAEQYIFSNVMYENTAALKLAELNKSLAVPASWGMVGAAIDPETLEERIKKCNQLGAPVEKLVAVLDGLSMDDRMKLTTVPGQFLRIISDSPEQEAASHSYAHIYADSVTDNTYREDFKKFEEIARIRRLPSHMTFIAPKNKVSAEIINIAREAGFVNVRVNPSNWLYEHRDRGRLNTLFVRVLRYADSILPINEIFELTKSDKRNKESNIIEGNFFFRPLFQFRLLEWLHFLRFKLWVRFALRTGRDIHVWTHPHNFGADVARGVRNYKRVIDFMQQLSRSQRIPFLRTSQASA